MCSGKYFYLLVSFLLPGLILADAIPVKLLEQDGRFSLLRGGEPYFIRGAGGTEFLEKLEQTGGNSVRTWGDVDREFLDRAHARGLSVCVGLWVDHERHGFDYNDPVAVKEQIARHCAVIDQLKDHPAVLLWGIGNEVELESTNPKVWDVIEAIAAHAKKTDPNHPTMTVVAHAPEEAVHMVMQRAPSIDILGCNSYEGLLVLAQDVRNAGWTGPYIVTEWGTNGMWEVDKTSWGAEIEATSTEKARQIRNRYKLIQSDADRCLGSYVFYWGNKQETTPTWFNLFMENGETIEAVDVLQEIWSGTLPQDPSPRIRDFTLNGKCPEASVEVTAGNNVHASFSLDKLDPSQLDIRWELLFESTDKRQGGDREQRPGKIPLELVCRDDTQLSFVAPRQSGHYRLYLYVFSRQSKAATANFPFHVLD